MFFTYFPALIIIYQAMQLKNLKKLHSCTKTILNPIYSCSGNWVRNHYLAIASNSIKKTSSNPKNSIIGQNNIYWIAIQQINYKQNGNSSKTFNNKFQNQFCQTKNNNLLQSAKYLFPRLTCLEGSNLAIHPSIWPNSLPK